MKTPLLSTSAAALGLLFALAPATVAQGNLQGPGLQPDSPPFRPDAGLVPPQVAIQPRMGDPLPTLTASERTRFFAGQAVFNTPLQIGDGLGPIFNDISCGACHSIPAVGGFSSFAVTRFGKAAVGMVPFDPLASLGGSLLQLQTIDANCIEVVPPEATVTAERLTPHVFGAGLLESVPNEQISIRDKNQSPPPGVMGEVRIVQPVEGGPLRAGRFGWKGGVATMLTFSADAGLNEMGLTNAFFVNENAPNGDQVALAMCDNVGDPEDFPDAQGVTKIERFTDFQRFTAPPPQTPKSGMTGEALFESVGCAACHVSEPFTTGDVAERALSRVEIKPYSDFLLHDMGTLGDGIVDGPATEQKMMTRALWGLQVRNTLLHDGRSTGGTFTDNLEDVIDNHAGEAAAARTSYQALSQPEKDQMIAFLQTLGQVEFDWQQDQDVDRFDWFFVESDALTGPGQFWTPDDFESVADIDQDGDVDLHDVGMFQRAVTN